MPVRQRRGKPTWVFHYKQFDGQWVRQSSKTTNYEDAEAQYRLLTQSSGLPVREAVTRFFTENHLSEKTRSEFETSLRVLKPRILHLLASQVDRTLILDYISARKRCARDSTIRAELACLRSIMQFATTLPGGPSANPVLLFDELTLDLAETRFRFFSEQEIRALMNAIPEARHRLIVLFGIEAGLRRSEILRLRVRNLSLLRRAISVNPAQAQRALGRVVPMSRKLVRAVIAHLRTTEPRPGQNDLLITDPTTGLAYEDVQPWWETAVRRAGLSDIRFHDTRHHFASMYMQRGGRLAALAVLLGHRNTRTVERYAYLSPHAMIDEWRQVNGWR